RGNFVGWTRVEYIDIHTQADGSNVSHSPVVQDFCQSFGRDQRRFKSVVKVAHITSSVVHQGFGHRPSEVLSRTAQIRLGKMRMIKSNRRNSERAGGRDGFPSNLVR